MHAMPQSQGVDIQIVPSTTSFVLHYIPAPAALVCTGLESLTIN